ncbi:MAG: hypothetical protein AAB624_01535 [Patescibacteria group bacterium]
MKLNDPIPFLENWRKSKFGEFTRRTTRVSSTKKSAPWPILLGCFLPLGIIALSGIDRVWKIVSFLVIVTLSIVLYVLILSAHSVQFHQSSKQSDVKSLTEDNKELIRKKLQEE